MKSGSVSFILFDSWCGQEYVRVLLFVQYRSFDVQFRSVFGFLDVYVVFLGLLDDLPVREAVQEVPFRYCFRYGFIS